MSLDGAIDARSANLYLQDAIISTGCKQVWFSLVLVSKTRQAGIQFSFEFHLN